MKLHFEMAEQDGNSEFYFKFYSYEWTIHDISMLPTILESPTFNVGINAADKWNMCLNLKTDGDLFVEIKLISYNTKDVKDNCFILTIVDESGKDLASEYGSMLEVPTSPTKEQKQFTFCNIYSNLNTERNEVTDKNKLQTETSKEENFYMKDYSSKNAGSWIKSEFENTEISSNVIKKNSNICDETYDRKKEYAWDHKRYVKKDMHTNKQQVDVGNVESGTDRFSSNVVNLSIYNGRDELLIENQYKAEMTSEDNSSTDIRNCDFENKACSIKSELKSNSGFLDNSEKDVKLVVSPENECLKNVHYKILDPEIKVNINVIEDKTAPQTENGFEFKRPVESQENAEVKLFTETVKFENINKFFCRNTLYLKCELGLKCSRLQNIFLSYTDLRTLHLSGMYSIPESIKTLSRDLEKVFLQDMLPFYDNPSQINCNNLKAHKALLFCRCPILLENIEEDDQTLNETHAENTYDISDKIKFCIKSLHSKHETDKTRTLLPKALNTKFSKKKITNQNNSGNLISSQILEKDTKEKEAFELNEHNGRTFDVSISKNRQYNNLRAENKNTKIRSKYEETGESECTVSDGGQSLPFLERKYNNSGNDDQLYEEIDIANPKDLGHIQRTEICTAVDVSKHYRLSFDRLFASQNFEQLQKNKAADSKTNVNSDYVSISEIKKPFIHKDETSNDTFLCSKITCDGNPTTVNTSNSVIKMISKYDSNLPNNSNISYCMFGENTSLTEHVSKPDIEMNEVDEILSCEQGKGDEEYDYELQNPHIRNADSCSEKLGGLKFQNQVTSFKEIQSNSDDSKTDLRSHIKDLDQTEEAMKEPLNAQYIESDINTDTYNSFSDMSFNDHHSETENIINSDASNQNIFESKENIISEADQEIESDTFMNRNKLSNIETSIRVAEKYKPDDDTEYDDGDEKQEDTASFKSTETSDDDHSYLKHNDSQESIDENSIYSSNSSLDESNAMESASVCYSRAMQPNYSQTPDPEIENSTTFNILDPFILRTTESINYDTEQEIEKDNILMYQDEESNTKTSVEFTEANCIYDDDDESDDNEKHEWNISSETSHANLTHSTYNNSLESFIVNPLYSSPTKSLDDLNTRESASECYSETIQYNYSKISDLKSKNSTISSISDEFIIFQNNENINSHTEEGILKDTILTKQDEVSNAEPSVFVTANYESDDYDESDDNEKPEWNKPIEINHDNVTRLTCNNSLESLIVNPQYLSSKNSLDDLNTLESTTECYSKTLKDDYFETSDSESNVSYLINSPAPGVCENKSDSDKCKTITIDDIDPHALFWILRYIYSGRLNLHNQFLFMFTCFRIYKYSLKFKLRDLTLLLAPITKRFQSKIKIEKFSFNIIENYRSCLSIWKSQRVVTNSGTEISCCLFVTHEEMENTVTCRLSYFPSRHIISKAQCTFNLSFTKGDETISMEPRTEVHSDSCKVFLPNVCFDLKELCKENKLQGIDNLLVSCDLVLENGYSTDETETIYSLSSSELSPTNLSRDLRFLFTSKRFSDVCLRVADQKFDVHRFLLCARSPVFATMLKDINREIIEIRNITESTFQSLLLFIYTGEVLDCSKGLSMYEAAIRFSLKDLEDLCRRYMVNHLDDMDV